MSIWCALWPRLWVPETLAFLGNFLAMCALVTVLAVSDGKPMFYWHGITLNTLISAIATTAKALIMFVVAEGISQWKWMLFLRQRRTLREFDMIDSASRGPWGSLKMLWKCRVPFLVQIGAVVTVLGISVEPLFQQLIQYDQLIVEYNNPDATVVRAQRYSKGTRHTEESADHLIGTGDRGLFFQETSADIDYSMQAAILYGLTQPLQNAAQEATFRCPSGNCTWDAFKSLAVCSICNNVTERLQSFIARSPLQLNQGDVDSLHADNITGLWLPNGLFLDDTAGGASNSTASLGVGEAARTVSLKDIDTMIWAMTFLRENSSRNSDTSVDGVECGIFYCVKRYKSKVEDGVLLEAEAAVTDAVRNKKSWWPLRQSGYQSLQAVADFYKDLRPSYSEPSAWSQPGWTRIDYGNTTTTRKFDSLQFDKLTSSIDRSDLMLGNNFNISQNAVVSISSYFQSTFATGGMAYVIENASFPGQTFQASVNGYRTGTTHGRAKSTPSILRMLFDSPDLDATFRSLARSMSNAIRAGSDESTVQTGRTGTTETLYRIEWGYVMTHCVVVISGSTFLVLTVYKNRRQKVPVWKSSALAVLLYGPDAAEHLQGAKTIDALQGKAAAVSVQMTEQEDSGESESAYTSTHFPTQSKKTLHPPNAPNYFPRPNLSVADSVEDYSRISTKAFKQPKVTISPQASVTALLEEDLASVATQEGEWSTGRTMQFG